VFLAEVNYYARDTCKITAVHELFALRAGNIANRNFAVYRSRPLAEISKCGRPLVAIDAYIFEGLGVGPNAIAARTLLQQDLVDR
jgi:hypothetical protein